MPAAGRAAHASSSTCPSVQTFFDFVSEDGAWIYFHANDAKPDSYAIYRWSSTSKAKETVFARARPLVVADHRPDGRLLLQKATGSLSGEYCEWDPATRELTPAPRAGRSARSTSAAYGAERRAAPRR